MLTPLGMGSKRDNALLKTGQLTSYVTGDDGDLELGEPKNYTILTTGQYSGTTNITLNGKTDVHSNNCVLDTKTRKMWSRYCSASVGPGSDGKLPWTTNGNGEGIFTYCTAANAASLSGYTDWRDPNINELFGISNWSSTVNPVCAPNSVAFPVWPSDYIYSSTSGISVMAMAIDFYNGRLYYITKTNSYFCVLVRG